MDNNNNRSSRTGRRSRNRRRPQNLRPVLPNLRPSRLQNPSTSHSSNPSQNFQALGENWLDQPEIWLPSSEYWSPNTYWSSEYWGPPSESWPPVTDHWRHTVGNLPSLTEDGRSLLLSNDGQALFRVLNRTNSRAENTVPNNVSASVTEEVQTEEAGDPDVVYLYSVDTSAEGHFAEELDLTADSTISSIAAERSSSEPVSEEPQPVKCSKSRKRKLSNSGVTTEKRYRRNTGQPCCSFCQAHYDELRERNKYLCAARCGHMFCRPCTGAKGVKKVCNICKASIGSLYKIFL